METCGIWITVSNGLGNLVYSQWLSSILALPESSGGPKFAFCKSVFKNKFLIIIVIRLKPKTRHPTNGSDGSRSLYWLGDWVINK